MAPRTGSRRRGSASRSKRKTSHRGYTACDLTLCRLQRHHAETNSARRMLFALPCCRYGDALDVASFATLYRIKRGRRTVPAALWRYAAAPLQCGFSYAALTLLLAVVVGVEGRWRARALLLSPAGSSRT